LSIIDLNTMFTILLLLLISLIVFAVCAVMIKNLLKAAIALGVTSAVLTVIMFLMNSYLAAAFELSVCAGLITVVFISTISLAKPQTREEIIALSKQRIKRYIYLPVLLVTICIVLFLLRSHLGIDYAVQSSGSQMVVQDILWNVRRNDMLGQIIITLAGVFGVITLFKERDAE
jgi:NADH-quinone oxidoreductase subunit J